MSIVIFDELRNIILTVIGYERGQLNNRKKWHKYVPV